MKKITACSLILAILLFVSGCSGEKYSVDGIKNELLNNSAVEIPMVEVPENPHKGEMQSFVTGEWIPVEQGKRRPIAVMQSNIQSACPQTGISRAGVIYEAPVEGGITRLMAIYEGYDSLEKIGSVRSCRNYYVYYAAEFDAVYAHYGQAAYALELLNSDFIDNLSGLESVGRVVYYRTSDRKAPHNAYASGQGLNDGIVQKGYRTHYEEGRTPHYQFTNEYQPIALDSGRRAYTVAPGYSINKPWFEYQETEGVYYRYQYGMPQIDDMDQSHLSYKNILIQYSEVGMFDASYLNIDTEAGGMGVYITNGKAIDITWQKDTATGITRYYDAAGIEITLNMGKTWVCIVQNTKAENVEIS